MRLRILFVCLCGMLMLCTTAWGQDITAQIAGTVTDPSGAVVPNAKVEITNSDKNVVVKVVTTDSGGNFSVPYLQVGHYSATITAGGFQTFVQQDIALHASDRYTLNAQMHVGKTTEQITVESAPIQVELQSQAASGLISGTEMRELSLNNRVFEQLVILQPGVSNGAPDQLYIGTTNPFTGLVNRADFAINGARTNMNNWTIDGADNVDRGSNLTLLNYPSPDAISEFKVIRSLYNAEYGRAGGGQMNVVTRSGGSAFHGGLYEFWRNDDLNANNFFTKRSQITGGQANKPPKLRYNNFGGTFGGPVYFPGYNKEHNKTFFFVSQDFRRVITYATAQPSLPTANEKQGIMQFPVCVGTVSATTSACTGATSTTVPITSPLAQAYLKDIWSKMPAPQDPLTHLSQLATFRNQFDNWQDLVRIDHVFGPRLSVYGRYVHDTIPTHEPFGIFGPNSILPGVANTRTTSPGTTWAAHATVTFSPTFLLEGGYNFSYGAIISRIEGLDNPANSPDVKANLPFAPTLARLAAINTSFSSTGGIAPYDDFNRNHTAFGNFTKVWGPHTMKFGFTYHHYQKTENADGNNPGTFSFDTSGAVTAGLTGNNLAAARAEQAWANFLMGRVSSFSQASADITPNIQGQVFEGFVQDEFRIRPNLTINYGVRWMNFRQPIDANKELDNFDPAKYDPTKAPLINPANGLIVVNAAGQPTQGDPLNGIIVAGQNSRFGSKIANENNANWEPRIGLAWDPFGQGKTSIRTGYGISHDFIAYGNYESNIFTNPPFVSTISISSANNGGTLAYVPFDNPGSAVPSISSLPRNLRIVGLPFHTPYVEQWSLDLQQEVASGTVLDVGYFGAEGHHLTGFIDLNQPQVGAYVTQLGIAAPITNSANSQRLNAIRPFLGYGAITDFVNAFGSNYHSLQASFQKTWHTGSLVKFNYTWSKNLGDVDPTTAVGYSTSSTNGASHTSAQDRYNTNLEYGPTSLDRRHIVSANWVLMEPWFQNQQGILGHLLGGWELTGILVANTGLNLTPRSNPFGAVANVDWPGLGCIGVSSCISMPNQVGDPNSGAPHTLTQWFNPAAFVANASVAPGNARRGSVIGPGFWRQDLSLFKNFKVTERTALQFRAETFNLLNHTNFNTVNMTLGSSAFNTVTSTRDPRIMQLALKLNF
jgi:hypothetical protein